MHQRHLECYFKFSEPGRRNDLPPRSNIYPTPAQDSTSSQPPNCDKGDCFFDSLSTEVELNKNVMSRCGIVSDLGVSFFATSDRLHYPPLIHANVSSGASCRARVEESYRNLDVRCLPVYVSPGVPPWVHVFSVFWLDNSYPFQSQSTGNERMSNRTTFFLYFCCCCHHPLYCFSRDDLHSPLDW
jgi:hypothetical protein